MSRAMDAWNSLPVQTRNVDTKEGMKVLLKNSIIIHIVSWTDCNLMLLTSNIF